MTNQHRFISRLFHRPAQCLLWSAAVILSLAFKSFGSTIAFWTFEGDGLNTPTNGMFVKDTDGRVALTADGTLVVNSGTVNKSGGGNFVVCSLGASGTLIVNGRLAHPGVGG